eukprot:CAMPEP_0204569444 /NCGR_PEP_ID=MMETSP0661-20131031/37745_1 /ASSEMBLY_ACC=CAM_ASM_000606 /TAXON_ID=109239 /ORGANISM="Alexandrium margalefi, Strain AMGDE01CS-322" /LENGTH=84 /DNA_ID=CAMNT_0051577543 /DNA_START=45 /DNA_END=297 /DNA_ORIENTATION=-
MSVGLRAKAGQRLAAVLGSARRVHALKSPEERDAAAPHRRSLWGRASDAQPVESTGLDRAGNSFDALCLLDDVCMETYHLIAAP